MTKQMRAALVRVVKVLFGLLGLGFAYILFIGLGANPLHTTSEAISLINQLGKGTTSLHRVRGERVWISRFSSNQLAQIANASHAVNTGALSCSSLEYCAFKIATEAGGAELVYSATTPVQLKSSAPWIGGFVNPKNGAVYDLRGRAYIPEHLVSSQNDREKILNLTPFLIP